MAIMLLFVSNEQIDASIALLLQENDGRSTAVARRHQFRPVSLYAYLCISIITVQLTNISIGL